MKQANDIREALKKIVKTEDRTYSVLGKVIEVYEDENLCDVQLLNSEIVIFDVLINATDSASFVQIPTKDSVVVISFLAYNTAFISQFSNVNLFDLTTRETGGSEIENLKNVMIDYVSEMYDNIAQMQLNHPQGTTIAKPINDALFMKSKDDFIERIKKVLK